MRYTNWSGVGKCSDNGCEFCREELLEAPLDLELLAGLTKVTN